jgi:hypothetical protein
MEVLIIFALLFLAGDMVTHGRVTAVTKGTAKGTATTGARSARAHTRRARDKHRAYLESGKAPLGQTRLAAGRGVRALTAGALDGIRKELADLRTAIDAARAEAEADRVAALDPAEGVKRGRLGHSFDQPPKTPRAAKTPTAAPAPRARTQTPAAGPPTGAPPAVFIQPTGRTPMTTSTHMASNAPENLPDWLEAIKQHAANLQSIHEAGVGLGIESSAQGGVADAVDILNGIARDLDAKYRPLMEAADATPQGAEQLTVANARTQ